MGKHGSRANAGEGGVLRLASARAGRRVACGGAGVETSGGSTYEREAGGGAGGLLMVSAECLKLQDQTLVVCCRSFKVFGTRTHGLNRLPFVACQVG